MLFRLVAVWGCSAPSTFSQNGEGAFVVRPCVRQLPHRFNREAHVVQAVGGVGVLRSEGLFADGEGAFKVRPCGRQLPHILQENAEIVEAGGRVGVVGAEGAFLDGEGAFIVRPCGPSTPPSLSCSGLSAVSGWRRGPVRGWRGRVHSTAVLRSTPPSLATDKPRLLRLVAVSGWSAPSTFSWMARARSKYGRAAVNSPIACRSTPKVVEAEGRVGVVGAEGAFRGWRGRVHSTAVPSRNWP